MFDFDGTLAALTEPQRAVLLALLNADASLTRQQIRERCPDVGDTVMQCIGVLRERGLVSLHHAWPAATWWPSPWLRNVYAAICEAEITAAQPDAHDGRADYWLS